MTGSHERADGAESTSLPLILHTRVDRPRVRGSSCLTYLAMSGTLMLLCLVATLLPAAWIGPWVVLSVLLVVIPTTVIQYRRRFGSIDPPCTIVLDEGGLRISREGRDRYLPAEGVRATLHHAVRLRLRHGWRWLTLRLTGSEVDTARALCAALEARGRSPALTDPELAALGRRGQSYAAWVAAIDRALERPPRAALYRAAPSALDGKLVELLQHRSAQAELRAAAAYALLRRDPSRIHALVAQMGDATPPLVVALAYAASGDERLSARYADVERFLPHGDRHATRAVRDQLR
jgi:hypothetical protein